MARTRAPRNVANPVPVFTQSGPQFYEQALVYNRPWSIPPPYQTQLDVTEETNFQAWIAAHSVPFTAGQNDPTDYDWRGYWKESGADSNVPVDLSRPAMLRYQTPYSTHMAKTSKYASKANDIGWHGDILINDTTSEVVYWARYNGSPRGVGSAGTIPIGGGVNDPASQSAVSVMENSSLAPAAIGKGLIGNDLDLMNFVLYLGHKIRLKAFDQVMDARVVLTIDGASTIEVDLNDDDRAILRSGTLTQDLDLKVDGLWWRLAQVKKEPGDNLTLVFETREISILRRFNSFKMSNRRDGTRSEFILSLIREALGDSVKVMIPELHMIQPVESATGTKTWSDSTGGQSGIPTAPEPDTNSWDQKGLPGSKEYAARNLTVKGQKADAEQIANANIILDQGIKMGASGKSLLCSIMTAIVENSIKNTPDGDRDSVGVFQQRDSWGSFEDRYDVRTAAALFFKDNIAKDKANPNASYNDLCQLTQKSGTPYAYGKYQGEAEAFLRAYGITVPKPTELPFDFTNIMPGGIPQAVADAPPLNWRARPRNFGSDYVFYRGTPVDGNRRWEREDSWTCIQRLATEVQWRAFFRQGVFWYLSEPKLFEMQAIMNISEASRGVDSIAFDYDRWKKTATVDLKVRTGRWSAPPGAIVILHDMGPANGKWLTNDFNRSMFDLTAEVTLKKPLPSLPEPADQQSLPGQVTIPPQPGETPSGGSSFTGAYTAPLPSPPRMKDRDFGGVAAHHSRPLGNWESDDAYDLKAAAGTPVYAVESGTITKLYLGRVLEHEGGRFGAQMHLKGDTGTEWFYTHFENVKVKEGDKVLAGQELGNITNWLSGDEHLHIGCNSVTELERMVATT